MYKITRRIQQNSENCCNLRVTQRKGLQFHQTRSNAITLFDTSRAICIEKMVHMKTGEELYSKVYESPRLPRTTVLTSNLHHGRHCLSNPKARTSPDHQSKRTEGYEETRSAKFEETRSGNIDFRNQRLPHTQQSRKKTMIAEQKLIHHFDTDPNRDSLMEGLNKTEEIQSVQRKVEGVDQQHG